MTKVAESYLAELAHKYMVKVKLEKEESSLRKFKSCRLHDLMRDLSLSKAEEEGFFKRLDIRTADGSHHHDLVESRRLVIYFDQAISSKDSPLIQESTRRRLRSLLWFSDGGENMPPIFRLHLAEFRLLRVLALEGLELDPQTYKQAASTIVSLIKLAHVLGSLFHLRYLSLRRSDLVFFPSFIENLKLLETLDLRVTGRFCRLPWTTKHWLQKMGRLRHLYLPDDKTFDIGKVGKLRFDGCLSKLETLENFDPSYCEVKDLPKLNSLRKNLDDLEEIARYQSSVAPGYLQYLSLTVYYGRDLGRGQHVPRQLLYNVNRLRAFGYIRELPEFDNHTATRSLITLILCFSQLSKDPMPVLEKIPTLRKLILSDTFLGKEMVCSAMGFPQLKSLTINHMRSLQIWKVDDGAMPKLLKLKIKNFLHLEVLPEGLKFLNALRTLEITGMRRKLCDRVRVVYGEPGADFYKIAHVPSIIIQDEQD